MRLFAAIDLPESLKDRLALMHGGIPGARWVPRDNMHLTLAFIGEVDEDTAERTDEALAAVRAESFPLTLKSCGLFSKGPHPEALWIGIEPNDTLNHLQKSVCRALESARVPFEARKFTPHVTLARLKHVDEMKLSAFISAHTAFEAPPFTVTEFTLFESVLTKSGSVYEALGSYGLG